MNRRAFVAALLSGGALGAASARAGDGYRMGDYDAPTPETLNGALTVEDDAAYALWRSGRVPFIDVMPDFPRPKGLPEGTLWKGRARHAPPGTLWLPDAGFGALTPTQTTEFQRHLTRVTGGDRDAPVLFLCRADCWLSWNAARRAVAWGYTRVFWYRDGTTGWTFWDWPTERMTRADTR